MTLLLTTYIQENGCFWKRSGSKRWHYGGLGVYQNVSNDKRWHYGGKCIPFNVCIIQFMGLISCFHFDEQQNGLNFHKYKRKIKWNWSNPLGTPWDIYQFLYNVWWKLHKYWEEGFPFVGGKRKFIVCRKSYVSKRNQALIQMH